MKRAYLAVLMGALMMIGGCATTAAVQSDDGAPEWADNEIEDALPAVRSTAAIVNWRAMATTQARKELSGF